MKDESDVPNSAGKPADNDPTKGEHFQLPVENPNGTEPWEEVAPGRYMPKRVRGSCVGRALG
ncbi:MAG: hypothetical protein AAF483_16650 [Planctomycetota bacterium]